LRSLHRGLAGSDVLALQQFLIAQNLLPQDSATGYFGALTEAAVKAFQAARGIASSGSPETTGYGAVGPKTRALLSSLSSSGAPTNPVTSSLAGTNARPLPVANFNAGNPQCPYFGIPLPSDPCPQSSWQKIADSNGCQIAWRCSAPLATLNPDDTPSAQTSAFTQTPRLQSLPEDETHFASCSIDGVTLSSGQSGLFYSSPGVQTPTTCASISQMRLCTNGSLSGSPAYQYATCSQSSAPLSCTKDGVTLQSGIAHAFYNLQTVPFGSVCASQTRACANGQLSGDTSYQYAGCSTLAQTAAQVTQTQTPLSCTFNSHSIPAGQSVAAYQTASVAFGSQCASEQRLCTNGSLSGSYNFASCAPADPLSCMQNGVSVAHGSSKTFYSTAGVNFGDSCANYVQSRACQNGTLSGSTLYQYVSCTTGQPSACTFNNQTVPNGSTATAYQSASAAFGQQCVSQTRTCTNGTLSGSYNFASCSIASPLSCAWNGQSLAHAASVTAYQAASVPFGQQCASESRICGNGALSGTYQFASCAPAAALACSAPWGASVGNGASVTAFQSATVPYGQSCVAESRTCSNGSLSGSYANAACSIAAAQSCTVGNTTLANGATQTFFSAQTVAYGSSCTSVAQPRTCTNGTPSGSFAYQYANCVTAAPTCSPLLPQTQVVSCPSGQTGSITQTRTSSCPTGASTPVWSAWSDTANTCETPVAQSCTAPDGTVVQNGQYANFYSAQTVTAPAACSSIQLSRTCSNGALSGSSAYQWSTCNVQMPTLAFANGNRVQTTAIVNVRSTPSTSGTALGAQALGALGTILDGATNAGGYLWWRVNWDTGVDGWSVQDYLALASAGAGACMLDGISFSSATSHSFYAARTVPFGTACSQGSRSCINGALGGDATYQYAACAPATAPACTPLAAQTQTVSCPVGQTGSITQTRTSSCPAGASTPVWSAWSDTTNTCATPVAQSCTTPWGTSVASGANVTAYQSASVPAGSQCVSEQRSCQNGQLLGSYINSSCTAATAAPSGPTLADLFAGTAHFQSVSEAQPVSISFFTSGAVYDEKLQLVQNPADGMYYSFSRRDIRNDPGQNGTVAYNLSVLRSNDGASFEEVGPAFSRSGNAGYYGNSSDWRIPYVSFYDSSVVKDASVSPARYSMFIECWVPGVSEAVSTCVSTSQNPFAPLSWSLPQVLIGGCDGNSATGCGASTNKSASTPIALFDNGTSYVGWTVIDEGSSNGQGDDDERAYTAGKAVTGGSSFSNGGTVLLNALPDLNCTSSWDCNNQNAIDWQKEGQYYYLIYSGSQNFYCYPTYGSIYWGVGIARATSPLGPYTRLPSPLLMAGGTHDLCRVTYPTINAIGGQTYLYYSYSLSGGQNRTFARSKLVWGAPNVNPSPTPTPTPSPTPTPASTPSCTPLAAQTQTVSCPSGQTGSITQTRTSSCPAGASTPVWSAWSDTTNTCATPVAQSCTTPWGTSVASGANVTAYQSASVPAGSQCVSEQRSCQNGQLLGSYINSSCTAATAAQSGPTSITDKSSFWSHLYSCILGRPADPPGLNAWIAETGGSGSVKTILDAYRAMFGSQEYLDKHVADGAYVDQVYQCALFHAPDPPSRLTWLGLLSSGSDRDVVLSGVIQSPEFQANVAPQMTNATSLTIALAPFKSLSQLASALFALEAALQLILSRL
jgi:peptidoglycan hydrolase-like protein with peptidoglycan-binding domain